MRLRVALTDTLGSVTPLPRGIVPDPERKRLEAAARAAADLHDAAIAALKAGGSVREVAQIAKLSTNTVSRWKREAVARGDM
jgi:DNA invertase Pin-like site-specific DNA recombinase